MNGTGGALGEDGDMPSTAPDRLQELILYIARKMERDGHVTPSRMKLAKLLWRIDFEAYARHGQPVSGTRYHADELGPAPTDELTATRDLQADLRFEWAHPFDRMEQPVAKDDPHLEVFTEPWVLPLVDEVMGDYVHVTAKQMVDEAHRFPGWLHAWDDGRGKRTPVMFEAVFWDESRTEAEPWENEYARQLAAERGL